MHSLHVALNYVGGSYLPVNQDDYFLPQLLTKLALQRYKYLQKPLMEEMLKILKFLKAFTDDERRALAIFTALSISESLFPVSVITSLLTYVCINKYRKCMVG